MSTLFEITRIDEANRVDPDRRVLFFVHNHYHLDDLPVQTIQARQGVVGARLAEVSQYFLDLGVNVTFVEVLSNVENDSGEVVRLVNPSCSPNGLNKAELAMAAQGDADAARIHMHWIDRYVDNAGATVLLGGIGLLPNCQLRPPEQNNAIIMPTSDPPTMVTLAHEIGHYFGLLHTNEIGNLMHSTEGGRGNDPGLTAGQREDIWSVIHNERSHLDFLSFVMEE